ncbi:putative quinol monooxygenase [Microbacterium excoecariae]|uniref:putative quinol monooxygenase n=1 Tax=Microbacterium excoecariae TaxID=2715210 RepID=UPI00140ACEEB|nr:antibiotic biosynthesis monooxygenase [Microbacterium excoecariae]NHI16692.1 antibiotic biosynthesis monooxygenase [Microbacterium excoecariae]
MTAIELRGRLVCRTLDEAEVVRRELPRHTALSRSEPGCVRFSVEPTADPLVWTVSEKFVDRASFDAHQERVGRSAWGRATRGIPRDYVIEPAPERPAT